MSIERTYLVEGMTCGSCELTVRDEVEELAGVQTARADRAAGTLTVIGDANEDQVAQAVAAAGKRFLGAAA